MKKKMKTKPRIFGLFLFLLGCLLATGHALAGNPTTLTVGGTDVLSGGYWTTNADGASESDYNVKYDKDSNTLTLDNASAVIPVGGTHTFTASLVTGGTSNPLDDCTWVSDNEAVATVANGVVTGVAEGTAQITCSYTSDSDTFNTSAMVTVTEANYRLVYDSNYPDGAKKYTYENGSTASVGDAVDTTVNETYDPGATATVAGGIFTTPRLEIMIVCFVCTDTAFPNLVKKVFSPTGSIFMKGLVE